MKRIFLLIISALCILMSSAISVAATSGQEAPVMDERAVYAGMIALLCVTIGVIIYVISTYFKK